MAYDASKSDIDFDFDDSDSDVSIATDASSSQFNHAPRGGDDDEEDLEFLRGIGGDDDDCNSVSGSDVSINSDIDHNHDMVVPIDMGDEKRCRLSSVDSDDFGPPIVVPLKTGSDHSSEANEPIDAGSRSSRGSRRSTRTARSGSFNRRAPVRTKSGEMTGSSHSTASNFRRRPPVRTKSGEGGVANGDDDGGSSLRRRPARRTKSGEGDGIRRRPPPRSKSGTTMRSNDEVENEAEVEEYVADMPGDDSGEEGDATLSPNSGKGSGYREMALTRNMARRQKSSDMLGAMRDATRNIPGRSKSMAGPGVLNGRRRNPGRAKSSDVTMEELASPGRKPLRRTAPPRTKSGSGGSLSRPPL